MAWLVVQAAIIPERQSSRLRRDDRQNRARDGCHESEQHRVGTRYEGFGKTEFLCANESRSDGSSSGGCRAELA